MTETTEELRRQLREGQGRVPLRRLLRIAELINEREPGDADALGFLCQGTLARGELARAAGYAKEIAERWRDNPSAWTNLAHVERSRGEVDAALAALGQALRLQPDAPIVLLRAAEGLAAAGHRQQAIDAAGAAFGLQPALRDAYRSEQAPEVVRQLSRSANALLSDGQWEILAGRLRELETGGAGELERMWAFVRGFLGRAPIDYAHPLQRPSDLYVPGLTAKPWWEREEVPCVELVEAGFDAIFEEMSEVVLRDRELLPYIDATPDTPESLADIAGTLDWSAFHFYRHGRPIDEHIARCPRTMDIAHRMPLMTQQSHGAECFFSVVRPRSRIPAHVGHSNVKLGIHFPLIVPPDCGFRVGGEARVWEVGRCLIFDDGFVHEVWNDSDEARIVFILDIWHPDLGEHEREALDLLTAEISRFRTQLSDASTAELLARWPAPV